mmetsp:Transcript_21120/g.81994  ORF Transcript_21120/g.81994 Transcript_21120/m.81994 type:complete len:265 (-) Transcript_21120:2008-2802(-)
MERCMKSMAALLKPIVSFCSLRRCLATAWSSVRVATRALLETMREWWRPRSRKRILQQSSTLLPSRSHSRRYSSTASVSEKGSTMSACSRSVAATPRTTASTWPLPLLPRRKGLGGGGAGREAAAASRGRLVPKYCCSSVARRASCSWAASTAASYSRHRSASARACSSASMMRSPAFTVSSVVVPATADSPAPSSSGACSSTPAWNSCSISCSRSSSMNTCSSVLCHTRIERSRAPDTMNSASLLIASDHTCEWCPRKTWICS